MSMVLLCSRTKEIYEIEMLLALDGGEFGTFVVIVKAVSQLHLLLFYWA